MSSASSRSLTLAVMTSPTFRRPTPLSSSFVPPTPLRRTPPRAPEDSPGLAAQSQSQSRFPGSP
jgi:hypothetical protein